MPDLTPQQALDHLLNAARLAPLTYQQHATSDHAAKVLAALIAAAKPAEPPPQDRPKVD